MNITIGTETITLSAEQITVLKGVTQYQDGITIESFDEILMEQIVSIIINPYISKGIRSEEVKKIEAAIEQKVDETIIKKSK